MVNPHSQFGLAKRKARVYVYVVASRFHPRRDLVGVLLQFIQIGADQVQIDIDLAEAGGLERRDFLHGDVQIDGTRS